MTNTKGKPQPSAPGYAASTGKADNGKIPNVQADPKQHNTQPAVNAMTNTKGKPQPHSKITKPGQELFQV
jgi:hypothetical protein